MSDGEARDLSYAPMVDGMLEDYQLRSCSRRAHAAGRSDHDRGSERHGGLDTLPRSSVARFRRAPTQETSRAATPAGTQCKAFSLPAAATASRATHHSTIAATESRVRARTRAGVARSGRARRRPRQAEALRSGIDTSTCRAWTEVEEQLVRSESQLLANRSSRAATVRVRGRQLAISDGSSVAGISSALGQPPSRNARASLLDRAAGARDQPVIGARRCRRTCAGGDRAATTLEHRVALRTA